MGAHIYTHMYACMYVCMYTHVNGFVNAHVYVYVHEYVTQRGPPNGGFLATYVVQSTLCNLRGATYVT